MTIALTVLALLAIVSAIGSASRVHRQRVLQPKTTSSGTAAMRSARDFASSDRLSTPIDQNSKQKSSTSDLPSNRSATNLAESLAALPKVSLATSLTVSETIHPTTAEPSLAKSGISSSTLEEAANSPEAKLDNPHVSHNLLQEIQHLEQAGWRAQITYLSKYLEQPDSVLRVAATFALGELASKSHGQELEELGSILLQLSHDANAHVRSQAATALARIPCPPISPPQ